MQTWLRWTMAAALAVAANAAVGAERMVMLDDCDPADPGWAPTGGCLLKEGEVTVAEFNALLNSVLSTAVVGHPSWRFEPGFAVAKSDEALRVFNRGGRNHTFTEVALFGGGIVPPLNRGLTPAPECATATVIPAGGRVTLRGLAPGDHLFQCCIHPWMRAVVRVEAKHDD